MTRHLFAVAQIHVDKLETSQGLTSPSVQHIQKYDATNKTRKHCTSNNFYYIVYRNYYYFQLCIYTSRLSILLSPKKRTS